MVVAPATTVEQKVDGIVRIPSDFVRQLNAGHADLQLIVEAADANRPASSKATSRVPVGVWAARRTAQGRSVESAR